MDSNQLKNMVVLKNLPSNIIDEAFIVLKSNKKIKSLERIESKCVSQEPKENQDGYIIKEAEMIIGNYLSNIEKEEKLKSSIAKQMEIKYKRLRLITIALSLAMIVSLLI